MAERTLLLVDDEENILRSLVRLLRRDGYTILTADGGQAGLAILDRHPVGVIMSDQRMPGMMGSEFLEKAKAKRPDTVRIMLSGYTDLQSVTDAINRGAIYKFLTKPWEDDLLRENIRQAFEQYELRAERDRLADELRIANAQLAEANVGLEQRVATQNIELGLHHRMLELAQEVLEHLPVGVVGIGDDGVIAVANNVAHCLLAKPPGLLLGETATDALPPALQEICKAAAQDIRHKHPVSLGSEAPSVAVHCSRMGAASPCQGVVVVLVPTDI